PAWKPPSSIDVDLPDGITDDDYLAWLDNALSSSLRQFTPDLICYIAGADPYREDQLGGLGLTIEGLKKRDELVFRVAKAQGIPVMVTYAGGYARKVEDTVTIHSNTVIAAKEVFSTFSSPKAMSSTQSKDPYNFRGPQGLARRSLHNRRGSPTAVAPAAILKK